jgi:integration host factor subunit beta
MGVAVWNYYRDEMKMPAEKRQELRAKLDQTINLIADKAGITRVKAETVVNTIFDSMVESLMKDDRIEIRGFGSFVNRYYEAYQGRNPRTGEIINVKEKKLPFFKVGKELKDDVNKAAGTPLPEDD